MRTHASTYRKLWQACVCCQRDERWMQPAHKADQCKHVRAPPHQSLRRPITLHCIRPSVLMMSLILQFQDMTSDPTGCSSQVILITVNWYLIPHKGPTSSPLVCSVKVFFFLRRLWVSVLGLCRDFILQNISVSSTAAFEQTAGNVNPSYKSQPSAGTHPHKQLKLGLKLWDYHPIKHFYL